MELSAKETSSIEQMLVGFMAAMQQSHNNLQESLKVNNENINSITSDLGATNENINRRGRRSVANCTRQLS
jgi:hypothetical protein